MGGEAGGGGRLLVGRSGGVRVEEDRVVGLGVRGGGGRQRPGQGGGAVGGVAGLGSGGDRGGRGRAGAELELCRGQPSLWGGRLAHH